MLGILVFVFDCFLGKCVYVCLDMVAVGNCTTVSCIGIDIFMATAPYDGNGHLSRGGFGNGVFDPLVVTFGHTVITGCFGDYH